MFTPQQIIHQINNMEHGAARLETIAQAVKDADDAAQHYWRLYFRYQYIKESTIHGDNFKGMICFPEYLRIFDEHPELQDDMYHDMMWAFKWLIGNLDDYYQIPLAEVNHYFEEFKKRSQQYGFSLRTYYMKLTTFWLEIHPEEAFRAYENFKRYPRNRNSDCEACELNYEMKIALAQNNPEQALKIAEPILQHEKHCAEIPHVTYASLARYYFLQKNFSEAAYYANLCNALIQGKQEFLREAGWLLEIYSCIDNNQGWRLFKYSLENFMNCHNPMMKMLFSRGAWRLLETISGEMQFVHSPLLGVLPVKPSGDGWHVRELADFFYQTAKEISQKLDDRNQRNYFLPLLEQELPKFDEKQVFTESMKSVHGLVKKSQTAIAVFLKQKVSAEELEQRIQNLETLSYSRDENACYISVSSEEIPLDFVISEAKSAPPLEEAPIQGMEQEELLALLKSPCCYALMTELSGTPLKSYHAVMKFLSSLFPELSGIVNMTALKAYPSGWVNFAGTYEDGISPHDLYSLFLGGSQKKNEVWGITIGLAACGFRELEFVGADTENFQAFADILDRTAAMCISRNHLPDENLCITVCRSEKTQEQYHIFWQNPETAFRELPPDSVAVSEKEDVLFGVLNLHHLPNLETIELPVLHSERNRIARLAEKTYPLLQKAMEQPFTQALIRLMIPCDEDAEYDFDLLWAKIQPDSQKAVWLESSELASAYQEGDETEIQPENIFDWRFQPAESEELFTPQEAWLLQEELS